MIRSPVYLVLLLSLTLTAFSSQAASEKDPKAEQIRRLQQAQRKADQERAKLAQEKSSLEVQVKELEDKHGSAQKSADAASRKAAALGRELTELRKTLAEKMDDADKRQKEQTLAIQKLESEHKRTQSLLAAEKQQHATCVARNGDLHKASVEVLEAYEKKSCLEGALQREPFTGLKRVEIENAVEDLREKLDSHRIGS